MVVKGCGEVLPGEISECTEKKALICNAHLRREADQAISLSGRFRRRSTCFARVSVNTDVDFLIGLRTCAEDVDSSSFYINETITGFLGQLHCRGNSNNMLRME